jgi:xylan 1,4-beta-xylosidase
LSRRFIPLAAALALGASAADIRKPASWAADNGNGTYSNPLFYDEFSDPDMIRVGPDYYLTGATMHTMPGLPILRSRDLVNWRIAGYAFFRLDLGPAFRLEDGKEIYGQGIWAPSFRYRNGTFYIFANVNRFGLQVFRASDPRGPWKHNRIEPGLHDLSVLFDDDGKIYAVYAARTIRIVELNFGPDGTGARNGSHPDRAGARHGRGIAFLSDQGQVLHRERHPRRPRSHEVRARGPAGGPVGSEDHQRGEKARESARAIG